MADTEEIIALYDEALNALQRFQQHVSGRLAHAIEQDTHHLQHAQYFTMRRSRADDHEPVTLGDMISGRAPDDFGEIMGDMNYLLKYGGMYETHVQALRERLESQKRFFEQFSEYAALQEPARQHKMFELLLTPTDDNLANQGLPGQFGSAGYTPLDFAADGRDAIRIIGDGLVRLQDEIPAHAASDLLGSEINHAAILLKEVDDRYARILTEAARLTLPEGQLFELLRFQRFSSAEEYAAAYLLNDLWKKHPEKFGDDVTRQDILLEANTLLGKVCFNSWEGYDRRECAQMLFQGLADIFERYDVSPLHGVTIGYLGRPDAEASLTAVHPLFATADFHNLTPADIPYPGTATSFSIPPHKADYLITGNVLNDPRNAQADDTMLACGNLLKEGGKALHFIEQGDSPVINFYDDDLYRMAGQKRAEVLMRGSRNIAVVAEQQKEVALKPEHAQWLREYRPVYKDQMPDTIDIPASHAHAAQQISLSQFMDFFLDNPDLLQAAKFVHWTELGMPIDIQRNTQLINSVERTCGLPQGWQPHPGQPLDDSEKDLLIDQFRTWQRRIINVIVPPHQAAGWAQDTPRQRGSLSL